MTTQFEKQVNNLVEIAAVLIREGKATIENAFQMAIELDNKMINDSIEAFIDMRHEFQSIGTDANKSRNGYEIVKNSTYKRLNAAS